MCEILGARMFEKHRVNARDFSHWAQDMIDEMLRRLGDLLNPDRNLLQSNPDALASIDVSPWMTWRNYIKLIKKEQEYRSMDGADRWLAPFYFVDISSCSNPQEGYGKLTMLRISQKVL